MLDNGKKLTFAAWRGKFGTCKTVLDIPHEYFFTCTWHYISLFFHCSMRSLSFEWTLLITNIYWFSSVQHTCMLWKNTRLPIHRRYIGFWMRVSNQAGMNFASNHFILRQSNIPPRPPLISWALYASHWVLTHYSLIWNFHLTPFPIKLITFHFFVKIYSIFLQAVCYVSSVTAKAHVHASLNKSIQVCCVQAHPQLRLQSLP